VGKVREAEWLLQGRARASKGTIRWDRVSGETQPSERLTIKKPNAAGDCEQNWGGVKKREDPPRRNGTTLKGQDMGKHGGWENPTLAG